ncbi:hypothetical protein PAXINDRAFT_92162 [Paxillus involutus ATCC 200175]|uniref:WD40 repeat domain-containing protein n=1 Tax=Paxillus involutus ATCC 200175 TaxID=664439 RepID=A0A0C9TDP1_PAXIN|nr:hypothetical protein PAXINDRAFT_92162 [Paxillus involutus ATCC 200175]
MLKLYDAARNAYLRLRWFPLSPLVLRAHTNTVRSVVFLPDGKRMVSGSKDGSIRTWRVEDGEELGMVMKEGGAVVAVVASSDGRWITTGGSKRTITIWNGTTNEKVIEWEAHTDWLKVLAFSPDSARVASGSRDQTAVIWNTTGERLAGPLTPLEGHPGWVVFTEFSPDGDRIATGGGNLIRIWRSHHGGAVNSMDTSPDGTALRHGGAVNSVAISHDGRHLASGGRDREVRVWNLQDIIPRSLLKTTSTDAVRVYLSTAY